MNKIITTKRTEYTGTHEVEETFTYEEIEKLFSDTPNCLVMQLLKKLKQTEVHCKIREKALYDIRKITEPGVEISKIAGHALCYGNYTEEK